MKDQNRPFLHAPKGIKVRCHEIGGDTNEYRWTVGDVGFRRLVAVAHNGRFTWVHQDFSA